MSQVIGHVSIALMQTPPQLLPALSATIVDLEALYVFQSTRFRLEAVRGVLSENSGLLFV
jgi:hypothetical protein